MPRFWQRCLPCSVFHQELWNHHFLELAPQAGLPNSKRWLPCFSTQGFHSPIENVISPITQVIEVDIFLYSGACFHCGPFRYLMVVLTEYLSQRQYWGSPDIPSWIKTFIKLLLRIQIFLSPNSCSHPTKMKSKSQMFTDSPAGLATQRTIDSAASNKAMTNSFPRHS